RGEDAEKAFRVVLHDGVVANSAMAPVTQLNRRALQLPNSTTQATTAPSDAFEVRFIADPSVYDGRFANSGWLQEMPDPLSKLTWDNAALISKQDADKLGVANEDVIRVIVNARAVNLAAFILPG